MSEISTIQLIFQSIKLGWEVFREIRKDAQSDRAAEAARLRASGMAAGHAAYLEGKRVKR